MACPNTCAIVLDHELDISDGLADPAGPGHLQRRDVEIEQLLRRDSRRSLCRVDVFGVVGHRQDHVVDALRNIRVLGVGSCIKSGSSVTEGPIVLHDAAADNPSIHCRRR